MAVPPITSTGHLPSHHGEKTKSTHHRPSWQVCYELNRRLPRYRTFKYTWTFSLRVWANKTGTGCLGTGWNHHRWRCSRTVEKWHWETWLEHMVGMGRNWMSLVVSSSLNDAMKNVFQSTRLQFQLENIFDSIVSHYHKHGNWMHKMNCM